MFNKISLKAKLIVIAIILIFSFPQKIHAASSQSVEELRYYYLEFQDDAEYWRSKIVSCGEAELSPAEKAFHVFEGFFSDGLSASIPAETKVLQVTINEDLLILNVSREIKNYGGTANEEALTRQLVETALAMPGIAKVTLLIEGKEDYLPEGSRIFDAC